ncbi:MAG: MCP four helix bundle domain-containing protein [Piscinibacter sp.]|uniref:methyl-accepting chemotaxis protein n=1 Tax=Piscinibacter sp. TaxID=1903157 RepID=UPI0025826A12|nr:methyl-accepting chemotaxis protein [Piscinibacter sp.]MCW5665149.1 MCP four helix bundle domain-containing protein [Piscinibacter sp.]
MNVLNQLRIGPRLGWAFGGMITLLLAVAALGLLSLREINESLHRVTDDYYVKVKLIGDIKEEINKQARFARNVVLFDDRAQREAELAQIDASRKLGNDLYEKLTPLVVSARGKELLGEVTVRRDAYRAELDRFLGFVREGRSQEARTQLMERVRDQQLGYMKGMESFSDLQEKLMDAATAEADADLTRSNWLIGLTGVLAVLLGIGLAWAITRSITRPIGQAVDLAERVAAGDLGVRIDVRGRDEAGQLLAALQAMTGNLTNIVGQVRQSSESIATGSAQIATGNADLSQRTEEQASNLQQTAASMEQLTSTVKQNADTARTATQLAQSANAAAGRGGEAVSQVVQTMGEISESSRKIADIIGTIDGIAFQTNILALNAAVEAARAGEQGRGFAVVAGEVRSLAQRSAEAAREIKALIGASVERVEAGSKMVDDAGATIRDVVGQVQRVADLIAEIGAATAEQTQGIEQVGGAVTQLDQVTQQNAALVEESAAAADSLKQQAERLVQAVGVFRLAA